MLFCLILLLSHLQAQLSHFLYRFSLCACLVCFSFFSFHLRFFMFWYWVKIRFNINWLLPPINPIIWLNLNVPVHTFIFYSHSIYHFTFRIYHSFNSSFIHFIHSFYSHNICSFICRSNNGLMYYVYVFIK